MQQYTEIDPWKIIQKGFNPTKERVQESLFSIGNGRFGQRGNLEETYSGDSLQGSYVAGVYYPDKTRVGWWKNGYPEYFAKVLNAPNWMGLNVSIDGETLDIAKCKTIEHFERVLDMKTGMLHRDMTVELKNGARVRVQSKRFCSLASSDYALLEYNVSSLNGDYELIIDSVIDGTIVNEDSNYDQKFWEGVYSESEGGNNVLITETRKTLFHVGVASRTDCFRSDNDPILPVRNRNKRKKVASVYQTELYKGDTITLTKKIAILSSLNHNKVDLPQTLNNELQVMQGMTFDQMEAAHVDAWANKWSESDIQIEGDDSAQQGIRFNIFQLNCTYNGEDERLNIGPKGFTGEKYGGSTYWDTEAYCLPFYQSTASQEVARNLLIYRHKHLPKAIENAEKLGFTNGAALYPMVTMNGEECHNEWEITFEEIHRNGAIAYAIYDYIKYTGDQEYMVEYGLEVLIGIARFWSQRVNWSEERQQYVMLGVTGPNEFENNINNNWYTNYIARWCMTYCAEMISKVKNEQPYEWNRIEQLTACTSAESDNWSDICNKMYFPYSEKHQVYLQQDGFLDKDLIPVNELPESERPIVEHWSWDRILRSCYIKQADVLQGFFFFEDDFEEETHRRHFDFYEPLTVHESSLSPCVHSVLAAKLGDHDRAYAFYLRTSRLDLDDYNNDTRDGLHITSMAGTWMSIVKGFAGMRVRDNSLQFKPFLPKAWKSFSFKIRFRGNIHHITVDQNGIQDNLIAS